MSGVLDGFVSTGHKLVSSEGMECLQEIHLVLVWVSIVIKRQQDHNNPYKESV